MADAPVALTHLVDPGFLMYHWYFSDLPVALTVNFAAFPLACVRALGWADTFGAPALAATRTTDAGAVVGAAVAGVAAANVVAGPDQFVGWPALAADFPAQWF